MVSTISIFQCTLMFKNPTQLFHNFQNVEWSPHLICNYDVECNLTTLNDLYTIYDTLRDLYCVEWFVLSWIICTYNEKCFWLRWNICTVVEWFEPFNKISSRKISPVRLSGTFSRMKILTMNIAPYKNSHKKIPPVRIVLQQIKKQNIFKI